ncbi:MAG: DEAD/DEAH box helicase [Desulfobacterales bacterium]
MEIILSNNLLLPDIPSGLYRDLTENLTCLNPRWLENNRMGRWNRNTKKELKFYEKTGKSGLRLPRGYIRELITRCRHQEIPCEIDDRRRSFPALNIEFTGKLKPFQAEAADAMLSREFGVLSAPTGSGKTIIALYLMAKRKQPSLIVVHTRELAFQWIDRISTFLEIPSEKIGFIGGGKRSIGEKVTVALVQSLYKCAEEVSAQIGHIIVDESHRCPSRTFTEAVSEFDSRYMLGLTATPFRRDKLSKLIFWYLGDLHHQVNKNRLVQNGDILKADVIKRETGFKTGFDPISQYSRMLSELTTDKDRNILIASDIKNESLKTPGILLILSDRKAHCENLKAILRYRFKVDSEVLTGDIPIEKRKNILEKLRSGEIKILIATGQLIGEGFDCPNLSTLFLATPIKFSGRLLQYIGRVLRPAPGKKNARIFDYIDVNIDVLKIAAKARQKTYDKG